MTTFFTELGHSIQERWLKAGCVEEAFPDVCAAVLAERPPSDFLSLDDVVTWGLGCIRLPHQVDTKSDFGEPPLTVFSEDRFYISVLVWLDGTTSIHEHAFSGAFHVLQGGSLHTTFDFRPSELVNEFMQVGELREKRVERLSKGDTREIHPGAGTIHQLFHLERPSATIVIRTFGASIRRPQYSYFRPGIAVHPLYDFDEQKVRRELLRLVARTDPGQLVERCMQWLDVADPVGAFLSVQHCAHLVPPRECDELLARVEKRHPVVARLVRPVVEDGRRESFLVRRRASVTDPELRFFLAVLLNIEGRERALKVIADRFPGQDPVDLVVRWVQMLGELPSPDSIAPSALGFRMDRVVGETLRTLLRGSPAEDAIRAVSAVAKRKVSPADGRRVVELCDALQRSEMFRSILAPA